MKHIYTFETFNGNETKVDEGLIKTEPLQSTIRYIDNDLLNLRIKYKVVNVDYDKNVFDLEIDDFNYNDMIKMKLRVIESTIVNICGYFPSTVKIYYTSGHENKKQWDDNMWDNLVKYSEKYFKITITFDSKFDEVYTAINKFMYHITNDVYLQKILKNGLVPKSKKKLSTHPDRIYLCETIEDCKYLMNKMYIVDSYGNFNNNKTNKDEKYSILKIDVEGLDIKIRKDPNYSKGCYITRNIAPDRIVIIESGLTV